MKCHYCRKKEAKLMWFVYQVCPSCWSKKMEAKKKLEVGTVKEGD